jgi:hypothetical protein
MLFILKFIFFLNIHELILNLMEKGIEFHEKKVFLKKYLVLFFD